MTAKPGNYIWKTKHHDQPVTVIRTLGTGPDGRTYVQIEGTNTGVPLDELQLAKQPSPFWNFLRKRLGL